jgi:hypothetical protein
MTKTIAKIEDYEGAGRCSACGREGLRWIVTLSDGTQIGTECAKRTLGITVAPKSYQWVTDYAPVAEHVEDGAVYVMWQRKGGTQTRETRGGTLVSVGGVRQDWAARGWLAA